MLPRRRGAAFVLDHYALTLSVLLATGVALRLVLAFTTRGVRYDLDSLRLVGNALLASPSRVYAIANARPGYPRWPYPPGFFPVILAVKALSSHVGHFESLIRAPAIAADAAIAWVVQDFLGHRGLDRGSRLAAAALVALGPVFVTISSIHGQIDAVAILPAVIALSVWERADPSRRAYLAGALIGAGAAVKGAPALMLLALAPSVRSRRELVQLLAGTAAVAALVALPLVALDGTSWLSDLNYNGGIGLGSLSLVAQPDLALNWLHVGGAPLSSISHLLYDEARLIAGACLLATTGLLVRHRSDARLSAVLIWLTVYVFGVSFFMQYMVWGLPFFLMAGFIRPVLLLQLLLVAPIVVIYHGVTQAWVARLFYVVPMLAVWSVMAVVLALLARQIITAAGKAGEAQPAGSWR